MRGCYLGVRGLESCYGNALFKPAVVGSVIAEITSVSAKFTRYLRCSPQHETTERDANIRELSTLAVTVL